MHYIFMKKTLATSTLTLLLVTTLTGCVSSSNKVVRIKDLAENTCTIPTQEKLGLHDHVLFDTDKSFIRPNEKTELDAFIAKLKSLNSTKQNITGLKLIGYTDVRSTPAYNLALSQRRVNSVKNYLVKHGIAASMIDTSAAGETNPVASNSTKQGRQQNRRVEIQVIGTTQ